MPFELFRAYGAGFFVSRSGSRALQYFIFVSLLVWKKKRQEENPDWMFFFCFPAASYL